MTEETAKKLDMEPYYMYRQKNMAGNFENVGYSKEGKECIYNILIMEEKKMVFLILFHHFVQVVSITVVFPRRLIVVFIPSYGQDCFITFFKFGDGLRIWLF